MRSPRFSLRWLLGLVALVAVACAIFSIPTYKARRLAGRINNGDFSDLDALKYPDQIWQYTRGIGRYSLKELKIHAVVFPMTWHDARQFRRRVSIDMWPPHGADTRLSPQSSSYLFVRMTGAKLGGEPWE